MLKESLIFNYAIMATVFQNLGWDRGENNGHRASWGEVVGEFSEFSTELMKFSQGTSERVE